MAAQEWQTCLCRESLAQRIQQDGVRTGGAQLGGWGIVTVKAGSYFRNRIPSLREALGGLGRGLELNQAGLLEGCSQDSLPREYEAGGPCPAQC